MKLNPGHPAGALPRRSRRGTRGLGARQRRARRAGRRRLLLVGQLNSPGARHPPPASSASPRRPRPAQKVTLTFWTWVPNMDKVVAIWNKAHPDIQVQVQVQAGGDAELTKLLTAAKAGNPPDLAQVEYQVLPTLVSNNYLADIAKYDGSLKSDFPAGNWNQVTLGTSALYGIPQDAAPMALFYRADLFKKYGLTVPTTWAQFAADADEAARRGTRRVPRLVLQRRPR